MAGDAPITSPEQLRDLLLDAAGISPDRLPMLMLILSDFAAQTTESLNSLVASKSEFVLTGLESGRMGEVLDRYEANAIVGMVRVPEWYSHVLIGFDRACVFALIEALFGADGAEQPVADSGDFSHIEMRLAKNFLEIYARALKTVFAPIADIRPLLEHAETRMESAMIGRRSNLVVVCKYRFQSLERTGDMFLIIPQAVLTPMRQALSTAVADNAPVPDAIWSEKIRSEVNRTSVEIRAILEERQILLSDVAAMRVGQVIQLEATANSRLRVESEKQALFWCHLGQTAGKYTLRVDDVIGQQEEASQ